MLVALEGSEGIIHRLLWTEERADLGVLGRALRLLAGLELIFNLQLYVFDALVRILLGVGVESSGCAVPQRVAGRERVGGLELAFH